MTTLITGISGFIGFSLAARLLSEGEKILGIDNFSQYYDVSLKQKRLLALQKHTHFSFYKIDITHRDNIKKLFLENEIDIVIHLAAQPGVRYSVTHPENYIDANLVGFSNILEACRQNHVKHFLFASSSSVYGANTVLPFSEEQTTDHPVSLYGATKKANEVMAYSYAHLYQLPCTGFRFFTVYGPWGRPDMALFKFTEHILHSKPITVFSEGNMLRDYTYIDDVISGILLAANRLPHNTNYAPYQIYNIGNSNPVNLLDVIKLLEHHLNKKAILHFEPMPLADIKNTFADVSKFESVFGALPHTPLKIGIQKFVAWYKKYYDVPTCVQ